jgi:YebC/PmpR family DNA-binding regulatory protein
MSGHNKWSTIKHKKGAADAKRGRLFTKLIKEITVAARMGGSDLNGNPRLRAAVMAARAENMPKDNIERGIKKGTGELGGEAIQEVAYEGYVPAGIAFIVDMATHNLNRSAADVRSIFTKKGGSAATQGSVSYQFDRKGEIRIPADAMDEEKLMEAAIEVGADDVQSDEDEHTVHTAPNELGTVANALRAANLKPTSEKLISIPQNQSVVDDADTARRIIKLHDQLDDYPDTLNVFTNFEVADEILDQLAS